MLLKSIDIYCERIDSSFWSEPVNALTNLCIFIAGLYAYRIVTHFSPSKKKKYILCTSAMAMITAIGSFLFHTFANVLTMWMDIIPITLFQILSINFFLEFIFKTKLLYRIIFLFGFVFLSLFLHGESFAKYLNGSLTYLPSIIVLIVFAIITTFKGYKNTGRFTLLGVGVFCISIFMRSIDMKVCTDFPLGTHFLWHSLNGVLIFLLLKAMISFQQQVTNDNIK